MATAAAQYISVHRVQILDAKRDVIDELTCCSDFCASQHPAYARWFKCQEISYVSDVWRLKAFEPVCCEVCGTYMTEA